MNLQYTGEEAIAAGTETVWAFVTDAGKVGHCFPDLIEVTVQDPTHVEAVVRVGVGPVRGKFKLKVELLPDAERRRIDMKISAGGFGSAVDLTAGADVVDAGGGRTLLKWGGQAVARGPVATVGGRVLDAQAKKLIEQAFANVRQTLSAAVSG
jgi:carbon monoxide dehydrogenase subunit G